MKKFLNLAFIAGFAVVASSCSKDKVDNNTDPIVDGTSTYVLGVGVTTTEGSTNYIVNTDDLMSGKISLLKNGILQEGYREYMNIGNQFYSIGGLGATDVKSYSIGADNKLIAKEGLVFKEGASDYRDVDNGKTMLGLKVTTDNNYEGNASFFFVDVNAYALKNTVNVSAKQVFAATDNSYGWDHSGIAISGNRAYQTVFPISKAWTTPDVKANYVAVYSYPDFKFQKLIQDTRTGPAGAPLMRSGIFATENGDLYTISHDAYGFEQNKTMKDPAILKIKAGSDEFDQSYYFKTTGITNGGKIIKAIYVGNGKLFAQVKTGAQATDPTTGKGQQWDQTQLKYAIVDLVNKQITAVNNSPIYDGAEDGFFDAAAGKVYIPAKVGSTLNVYQVDVASATAKKGVEIEATYVKGIGKLQK